MDSNQLTAYATLALATVGALAFIANVLIAGFTLRAARASQRSAEATERAAAATQRSAEATQSAAVATQQEADATREEADATRKSTEAILIQADMARRTLESGWRPFLVDVPYGFAPGNDEGITDAAVVEAFKRQDGTAYIGVSLRNIGSGLAIITRAGLSFTQLHTTASSFSTSIVAVGEAVRIRFQIRPEGAVLTNMVSQVAAKQPFIVTAEYVDQGGINKWRSRAYFRWQAASGRPEVDKVELYVGDEIKPFATTGTQ